MSEEEIAARREAAAAEAVGVRTLALFMALLREVPVVQITLIV